LGSTPAGPRDAAHWRVRAAEARSLAGAMRDPEAHRAMLAIAAGYERLADAAARRRTGKDDVTRHPEDLTIP
jgi:hypothetical protein